MPSIPGYQIGDISAQGAVIVELWAPPIPIPVLMNMQNRDRLTMDLRPGMQIKHLPYRYDETSGKMVTGGAYLFDTFDNAKNYARWVRDEFQVGEPKIPFFQQFLEHHAWVVKVLGGCNFAPVEEQAVEHVQLWTYDKASGVEERLETAYPSLRDAAEKAGATSVWMLSDPEARVVGVHCTFPKGAGDGFDSVKKSLAIAKAKASFRSVFPDELMTPLYDRTSPILTSWLPRSRAAGGVDFFVPFKRLLEEAGGSLSG